MNIFDLPLFEGYGPFHFALFVFLGALVGSFYNVLAMRWEAHQIVENDAQAQLWINLRGGKVTLRPLEARPLLGGRSACPHCNTPIPLYRNIPLISWVVQLGESACCKRKISPQYLLFEIACASIFSSIAYLVGPSVYGLFLATILSTMLLIAVIDARSALIPDGLVVWMVALSFFITIAPQHWSSSTQMIITTIPVGLAFWLLTSVAAHLLKAEVVGGSDIALLAICAGFAGSDPQMVAFFILLMCVLPIIYSPLYSRGLVKRGLFAQIINKDRAIPMAPAINIAGATLVYLHLLNT